MQQHGSASAAHRICQSPPLLIMRPGALQKGFDWQRFRPARAPALQRSWPETAGTGHDLEKAYKLWWPNPGVRHDR